MYNQHIEISASANIFQFAVLCTCNVILAQVQVGWALGKIVNSAQLVFVLMTK